MASADSSSSVHSPASPDPRHVFATCMTTARETVAGVSPDQLGLPTPCDAFDVRGIIGHIVFVLRRVAALGRGEDPFAVASEPAGVADDGWLQAWDAAAAKAQAAWADDAVLARPMRLPWAELPGAAMLAGYVEEVTTHTWDLATATGQHPVWDDSVLEMSFAAIRRMLPLEGRAEAPFDEAVEVPDDAPLIDRLVAYTGRQP